PLMIRRMIDSISSGKISRCSIVRCSASCVVMVMAFPDGGLRVRSVARQEHLLGALEKISQQRVAMLGEDGFRMKLDAFHRQLAMANAHDFAVVGGRGDRKACGHRRALDRERMVAGGGERRRQLGEYAVAV